jgi:hypothetical protein
MATFQYPSSAIHGIACFEDPGTVYPPFSGNFQYPLMF